MEHISAGSWGPSPPALPFPSLLDWVSPHEIKTSAALAALAGAVISVSTTEGRRLFLLLDGEPDGGPWLGPEYYTLRASEIWELPVWEALLHRGMPYPDAPFTLRDASGDLRLWPPPPRAWRVVCDGALARLWIAERDVWESL